jgi:hypothetical protein
MKLLIAGSAGVPLCDQLSGSSRVTRRESVVKPAPSLAFARLATSLTLALTVVAGTAATCSAAAGENPIVLIAPLGDEGVSIFDLDVLLILDHSSDIQTVDPDPATQFHGKAYRELGAEPVPIPHPNVRTPSSRPPVAAASVYRRSQPCQGCGNRL